LGASPPVPRLARVRYRPRATFETLGAKVAQSVRKDRKLPGAARPRKRQIFARLPVRGLSPSRLQPQASGVHCQDKPNNLTMRPALVDCGQSAVARGPQCRCVRVQSRSYRVSNCCILRKWRPFPCRQSKGGGLASTLLVKTVFGRTSDPIRQAVDVGRWVRAPS